MKRHLLVLDGLRGVAALAVVFYHFGGRLSDFAPMQHGYLAVDFFFALSGFVIAYAYEDRLRDGMGLRQFLVARLVRLMPLLILGLCIGAVLELGRPNVGDFPTHMGHVALAWLFGSFVVPLPVSLTLEQVIFPLNSVMWSLFFEFAINIAYALVAPRLGTRLLIGIILLSAPLLIVTALHFGALDAGSGFDDWWGGGARVLFSFSLGVLLYRLRGAAALARLAAPVLVLSVAILAVLAMPQLTAPFDAIYDLTAVMLVFPVIIGAGAKADAGWFAPLCRVGGDLSYPLYILHYRLVSMVSYTIKAHGYGPVGQAASATLATVLIAAFAYGVFRFGDEPLRRRLTRRHGRQASWNADLPRPPRLATDGRPL
ncbi:MAG: acyltransferase [Methylobacterium sp.]